MGIGSAARQGSKPHAKENPPALLRGHHGVSSPWASRLRPVRHAAPTQRQLLLSRGQRPPERGRWDCAPLCRPASRPGWPAAPGLHPGQRGLAAPAPRPAGQAGSNLSTRRGASLGELHDMILVVNADDAGVDRGRNRGILRASREGLVRSASVLVNFDAAKEFVEQARELDALGIGLHANFTEGPPLVKGHRSLIGANGSFLGKQELLRRGMAGLVDEREATRELEEQWAALERL